MVPSSILISPLVFPLILLFSYVRSPPALPGLPRGCSHPLPGPSPPVSLAVFVFGSGVGRANEAVVDIMGVANDEDTIAGTEGDFAALAPEQIAMDSGDMAE